MTNETAVATSGQSAIERLRDDGLDHRGSLFVFLGKLTGMPYLQLRILKRSCRGGPDFRILTEEGHLTENRSRPKVCQRDLHTLRSSENLHLAAENLVDGDTVIPLLDDLLSL